LSDAEGATGFHQGREDGHPAGGPDREGFGLPVRRHVSEVCEKHGVQPTASYGGQKKLFE